MVPRYPRWLPATWGVLVSLPLVCAGVAAQQTAGTAASADPHYEQVLKAYRGELSRKEFDALEEVDPAPSLYLGPKTPGERAVTRFFASLPEGEHARLRDLGYLKWRADTLPSTQKKWLKEAVRLLSIGGLKAFPLEGKEPAATGLVRVDVAGVDAPEYSWWIASKATDRPYWLTVVRALSTGSGLYFKAHQLTIAEVLGKPDTPAVPAGQWVRLKEGPAEEEEAIPTLVEERYYWDAVHAYRGDLKAEALKALAAADPLVGRRLKLAEPREAAVNRFFARLSDKEHRTLLTEGILRWGPGRLTKEQVRLLEPAIRGLNEDAQRSGGTAIYALAPYSGVRLGLAVVTVPEAEKPCVSFWVRSPLSPIPAWVTLMGAEAVAAPSYYRAHLAALAGE
jgi:hypothetical protein